MARRKKRKQIKSRQGSLSRPISVGAVWDKEGRLKTPLTDLEQKVLNLKQAHSKNRTEANLKKYLDALDELKDV